MLRKFFAKMQNEDGQGLIEYSLIGALIAVACVLILTQLGTDLITFSALSAVSCRKRRLRNAGLKAEQKWFRRKYNIQIRWNPGWRGLSGRGLQAGYRKAPPASLQGRWLWNCAG